ncbi:hypothetical protein HBB16_01340 [Pseudonocardia sp. MCCB 268]|nr:hypothetical protein [Pseudonocardia cytotoxica]
MLSETCTATRRPVAWDPWLAQEVRRASGLTASSAAWGPASRATGLVVYRDAAIPGPLDVLDPSSTLSELTRLPDFRAVLRHIQPAARRPGHPQPVPGRRRAPPDHFADDGDPERAWKQERSLAAATRRRLVLDIAVRPTASTRSPGSHRRIVLLRAVPQVGSSPDQHPGMVIDVLRRHLADGENAGVVSTSLDERREGCRRPAAVPDATATTRGTPTATTASPC